MIQVTQSCINDGERGNSHTCPIALAIKREHPSAYVIVGHTILRFHDAWYLLTLEMQTFARQFDLGANVEPFEFDLKSLERWI